MPIVWSNLGHRGAVAEHDLQTVLRFPGAFALDRDVDMPVAVGVPLDDRLVSRPNVVENVARAVDLDVPLVIAFG